MNIQQLRQGDRQFFVSEMPKTAIDVGDDFLMIHQWQDYDAVQEEEIESVVVPFWFVDTLIEILKAVTTKEG